MGTKDSTNGKRKQPEGGNNEKEQSSTRQKRAMKQERQSHRRHADAVVEAKSIWNKLRLRTNTKEETSAMADNLMGLLRGKMVEVALQHDASRVVQAAVQFGNEKQRREIAKELGSKISELAKSQYAHFVVLKLIKYCVRDDEAVRLIVKSLKGHISKLAVHAVGARVVELLFSTFPPKSTTLLKQEIYGPQFTLFTDGALSGGTAASPTLQSVFKTATPSQKKSALEHVHGLLQKGIDKGLFGFTYYQSLFCEYVIAATPNDIRSIAPSVVDHSIHMLSTRAGARVVAECAAYGTVKDRKNIMRSLKGYTRSSLLHRDAYIAVLRLADVVDDTVTLDKNVLVELQENPDAKNKSDSPILDLALSETGSKLFLMLLPKNDEARLKYFDPYELEVLHSNPTILEKGEEVPTSKKNPDTRRMELSQHLRVSLVDLCQKHAGELLRSTSGGKVLREVNRAFSNAEVIKSIVKACDEKVDDDDEKLPIFEDPVGHLVVKHLLTDDAESGEEKEKSNSFSTLLYKKFKGKLMSSIGTSNRGAFVLTALAKVDAVKDDVIAELLKHKSDIKALVDEHQSKKAGFLALWNEIQPSTK
mmetsp:Transcript_37647/g.55049  ORF Transcript_37647/g.55049 Transcript_37647/m.55049 type:complete len:590 (+) Transcript_37647:99-1868(+)